MSFHKFSQQLSVFSLCPSCLMSAWLVILTIYLFMKVSFSSDIIHSGWLATFSDKQYNTFKSSHRTPLFGQCVARDVAGWLAGTLTDTRGNGSPTWSVELQNVLLKSLFFRTCPLVCNKFLSMAVSSSLGRRDKSWQYTQQYWCKLCDREKVR